MRPVYFIADVHLRSQRPELLQSFIDFCAGIRERKPYLYILGDLFDVWLGDDMMSAEEARVAEAINSIHQEGGRAFFQAGNRDFLVGEEFLARCNCQMLSEETVVEHNDFRILICHGDSLCTADNQLQKARRLTRTASWRKNFLAQDKEKRFALSQQYFAQSTSHKKKIPSSYLRIPRDLLEEKMLARKCNLIIHGHTHNPRQTRFKVEDERKTVITLGDWNEMGWFALLEKRVTLHSFPIS